MNDFSVADSVAGFKAWTHDRRSPIQGGAPVWDGAYPHTLPAVDLDTSDIDCAPGWHYCHTAADALALVGLWCDGYPTLVTEVSVPEPRVVRTDKARAASLTVVRALSGVEIHAAITELSARWFPLEHREVMTAAQLAWHRALGRPQRDAAAVEAGLRDALAARGLNWALKQYPAAWAARDARAAWAARAARAAWDAWATWDAWAALTVQYAAINTWTKHDPLLLTTGIRDAYAHGLAIALPVAKDTLGWAMVEEAAQ